MRTWSVPRTLALAAVLLFALIFAALSVDIMVRVWHWRGRFETTADSILLLYSEAARTAGTLAGIVIALLAATRRGHGSARVSLAFAAAFATIAYTKAIAFTGFPGDVQERVTYWLLGRGVERPLLAILFDHPEWAAWLALGGLVLFAANYPRALTPADITRSGLRDRRGALRSVAVAGTDVGRLSREAAAVAVGSRLLRGSVVWPAALLAGAAHTAVLRSVRADALVNAAAVLLALPVLALLVALFRAGFMNADGARRRTLLWLRRGAIAGGVLFTVSAIATPLLPDHAIGFVALALAPVAAAACWLIAVSADDERGSGLRPAAPGP